VIYGGNEDGHKPEVEVERKRMRDARGTKGYIYDII